MRRATGHGEIAEGPPDFVPGHLAGRIVSQAGGAHGDRLDFFVAVFILGGKYRFDSGFEGFHW